MVRTTFHGVQPLSNPTYEDLDEIGRCLHFDDFEEALAKGYLVPQRLTNSHKRLNKLVLWFAPCQSMSTHNYYGNVTFVVKWVTLLQKLGPNLYLIDQAIYNSRSYTRIVLTSANYDNRLEKVDLESDNSALTRSWMGFRHAKNCFNKQRHGPHELQIAIEADENDARWLFQNCKPVANNHSLANTPFTGNMPRKGKGGSYESYRCFKFNTAQNKECPYQLTAKQCKNRVQVSIQAAATLNTSCSSGGVLSNTPSPSAQVPTRSLLCSPVTPLKTNKSLSVAPKKTQQISARPSTATSFDIRGGPARTRPAVVVAPRPATRKPTRTEPALVSPHRASASNRRLSATSQALPREVSRKEVSPNKARETKLPERLHPSTESRFTLEDSLHAPPTRTPVAQHNSSRFAPLIIRAQIPAKTNVQPQEQPQSGRSEVNKSSTVTTDSRDSCLSGSDVRFTSGSFFVIPTTRPISYHPQVTSEETRVPVSYSSAHSTAHTAVTSSPGISPGSPTDSSPSVDSEGPIMPELAGHISPWDDELRSLFRRLFALCCCCCSSETRENA